jgi:carbon-monoxide dehydrogenase medium subunit
LRVGALTRHRTLEASPLVRERFPVLSEAMAHVAHLAIRNRGTIGGSLAHADPAAELPMLALLLDAEIRTCSAAGARSHQAGDFFVGPLAAAVAATVTLAAGIVVEARLAAMGVGETPLRLGEVEARIAGKAFAPGLIQTAAQEARAAVRPGTDLHASADYRRHLVAVLTERALSSAWTRAVVAAT